MLRTSFVAEPFWLKIKTELNVFASDQRMKVKTSNRGSNNLGPESFNAFETAPIPDPSRVCHSLLSLMCDNREAVDSIVSKAIAAGGSKAHEPEDHGFMYQYGFYDLDGHGWGVFWFDTSVQPSE